MSRPLSISSTDCRYLYANRQVQALFGKPMDEIIPGVATRAFFNLETATNIRSNDRR
ncbi:MAG: hypothetical protein IPJ38_16845 [Dechloromonas sp.]|uniref:PAS domain-containing protein n=1 Tax=Candidatus Dechloromonas phosphorivorans TaxID=2899244 RepID=A0A935K6J4_9RHOO|nr:hypothetical protein [Candidatus Dechloromonas phosphorivorans]